MVLTHEAQVTKAQLEAKTREALEAEVRALKAEVREAKLEADVRALRAEVRNAELEAELSALKAEVREAQLQGQMREVEKQPITFDKLQVSHCGERVSFLN
ncbi:hypothetical protein SLA2020_116390 [Shorea laevis]